MVELRCDLDLAQEAFGAYRGCEFGTKHLERDLAAEFPVVGKVDSGHPAATELLLDCVAISQRRLQPVNDGVGHNRVTCTSNPQAARAIELPPHKQELLTKLSHKLSLT